MGPAVNPRRVGGAPAAPGDDQLVVIRGPIVENIGHVLGNLFQRLYHLIEQEREQRGPAAGHGALDLQAAVRAPGRALVLTLTLPAGTLAPRSAASELPWAVAEKLLETHGGVLHATPAASGEVTWEIVLPLQS